MLRFHGSKAKKTFEIHRPQLAPRRAAGCGAAHLPARARRLERGAPRGRRALRELGLGSWSSSRDEPGHVYHLFVCRSPERDRIRAGPLPTPGSGTRSTTSRRSTCSPRFRYLGYEAGALPETERAAAENFSLPLWAGIGAEQQEQVAEAVRSAVGVAARA